MHTTPYLSFEGNCREAMEFYRDLFGGEIQQIFSYGESPMAAEMPEDTHHWIMHSHLTFDGAELMGADGPPPEGGGRDNVRVALMIEDAAEAERIFAGLAEGGEASMPMQQTFWVERFGMCTDRFGIGWLVNGGKAAEMPEAAGAETAAG